MASNLDLGLQYRGGIRATAPEDAGKHVVVNSRGDNFDYVEPNEDFHGQLTGGALHSLASLDNAGFASAVDRIRLDAQEATINEFGGTTVSTTRTGTIESESNTLVVDEVWTGLRVGNYVAVYGAGEVVDLETPPAPTSVSLTGSGTTTYAYKYVYLTEDSGYSAAGEAALVNNGPNTISATAFTTVPIPNQVPPGVRAVLIYRQVGGSGNFTFRGSAPIWALGGTWQDRSAYVQAAAPQGVPSVAPTLGSNKIHRSRVVAIDGTTITLETPATTSVTGALVTVCNAPALAAALAARSDVIVPAGEYALTTSVDIPIRRTLRGRGCGVSILTAKHGLHGLTQKFANNTATFSATLISDLNIRGGQTYGNAGIGIWQKNGVKITVRDCLIETFSVGTSFNQSNAARSTDNYYTSRDRGVWITNTDFQACKLIGAIDADDTEIEVGCADILEGVVPYTLIIDNERLRVTAANGNVLTVTRGYGGTTPAAHADLAKVLTEEGGYSNGVNSTDDWFNGCLYGIYDKGGCTHRFTGDGFSNNAIASIYAPGTTGLSIDTGYFETPGTCIDGRDFTARDCMFNGTAQYSVSLSGSARFEGCIFYGATSPRVAGTTNALSIVSIGNRVATPGVSIFTTPNMQGNGTYENMVSSLHTDVAQGVGVWSVDPRTRLDVNGALTIRVKAITPAIGLNSDFAIGNRGVFEATCAGDFSLGGFLWAAATLCKGDHRIEITNMSAVNMTIVHQDAASTAGARIVTTTGADVVFTQYKTARLRYSAAISRWILEG